MVNIDQEGSGETSSLDGWIPIKIDRSLKYMDNTRLEESEIKLFSKCKFEGKNILTSSAGTLVDFFYSPKKLDFFLL